MLAPAHTHQQFRQLAKQATWLDVTREEFIVAMMEMGDTRETAEMHANVSYGLGAHTSVGNRMLRCCEGE